MQFNLFKSKALCPNVNAKTRPPVAVLTAIYAHFLSRPFDGQGLQKSCHVQNNNGAIKTRGIEMRG